MIEFWALFGFGTTYIAATCGFFLFLFFLNKLLKIRKTTKEVLPFLGMVFLFLFTSVALYIVSWFDYYRWEAYQIIHELYSMHVILMLSGIAGLSFLLEYVFKKTKYLMTIYIITGITITPFFKYAQNLETFTSIYDLPLLIILPIWYFVFIRPTSGFLKRRMLIALSGVLTILVGLSFRYEFMKVMFGRYIYSIGTILVIFGLVLVGYGFSAFKTITDLNWKKKLRELLVISESGVCLYAFSFEKNMTLEDYELIAGFFSSIQLLLSEMIKTSESLQFIEYQNLKIILEQSKDIIFVLIVNEESIFLPYKLKLFSESFQNFFKEILPHWSGDVSVFLPTRTLINEIFELAVK
ncbi:MAG: hypothetical protein ACFFCM_01485 [Promethearchaeota archaeon]